MSEPMSQADLDAILQALTPDALAPQLDQAMAPARRREVAGRDGVTNSGLSERQAAGAGDATAADPVRPYDFRLPGKFAKDQLRTLAMLHEVFARMMTSYFVGNLRTRVQINVDHGEQQSYQQYMQVLPNPTVLGTFRLSPLPGICLIHMSNGLALTIVDRVYGGGGFADQPDRPLTEIEQSVIRRVFQQAMGGLAEAWHRVVAVQPEMDAIEVNPLFVQVPMPGEVLAVINMTVDLGDHQGEMTLALPFTTVEPVLARLSPQSWFAAVRPDMPEQARELQRQIAEAPVPVAAQLGQVHLRVSEFLALTTGSVLVLNQRSHEDIAVYVGNQLTFWGRPGVVGNRMAVSVSSRAR